jgi:hypothetical protein
LEQKVRGLVLVMFIVEGEKPIKKKGLSLRKED